MILSMTGFATSEVSEGELKVTVDLRSLNSKYFDLNLRVPSEIRPLEAQVRKQLQIAVSRGKVDCVIKLERQVAASVVGIEREFITSTHQQLKELASETGADAAQILPAILQRPEAFSETKSSLTNQETKVVELAVTEAIKKFNTFRSDDGKDTLADLQNRINEIEKNLQETTQFDVERKQAVRDRLQSSLEEIQDNISIDNNRLEQELIYYLEKLDINEEKVRLQSHINFFREVMDGAESNGRKLNFISQEMGREINTIGSKANHAEMQKCVVQMKDELEKIKEQTLNIL